MPVGTGRYLELYRKLGMYAVGVDASDEMLALAKRKPAAKHATLRVGNATDLTAAVGRDRFEVVVCVRFLDLIDETAMQNVVTELCRFAERMIIVTIRFGDRYTPKANTAEHDQKKFRALIARCDWRIAQSVPIFNAGWNVVRLEPR